MAEIIVETQALTPVEKRRLLAKKYYHEKVKNDPELKQKESERIKAYYKNRYNTDEEYKKQKKEQVLKNYYNKKSIQKQFN